MSYPVAYRNAAARSFNQGGFQNPGGASSPVAGRPASLAQAQFDAFMDYYRYSNPNERYIPPRPGLGDPLHFDPNRPARSFEPLKFKPLYDPTRSPFGRRAVSRTASAIVARTALGGLSRLALRAVPWIGLALTLYDLWEWWKDQQQSLQPGVGGSVNRCPAGYPAFGLPIPQHHTRSPLFANCNILQAIPNPETYANGVFGNIYTWWMNHYQTGAGAHRGDYFIRVDYSGSYNEINLERIQFAGTAPAPAPSPIATIDPMQLPIHGQVGVLQPVPWAIQPYLHPNPFRDPTQQPRSGNTLPAPVVSPGGSEVTPIQWVPGVSNPPAPRPQHTKQPPGARTKEKKFIMSMAQRSTIGMIFNAVTEFDDLLDAFYKALPKEYKLKSKFYKDPLGKWRRSDPTIDEKFMQVYRALLHHDAQGVPYIRQVIRNIVQNQVGDFLGGYLGKKNAQYNQKTGRPGQGPGTVSRHASRGLGGPSPVNELTDRVLEALNII